MSIAPTLPTHAPTLVPTHQRIDFPHNPRCPRFKRARTYARKTQTDSRKNFLARTEIKRGQRGQRGRACIYYVFFKVQAWIDAWIRGIEAWARAGNADNGLRGVA